MGEVLVAVPALVLDPALEGVADEGVDDVADVAPGHLADLPDDGEGTYNGIMGEAPVKDEVHGERLVMGNRDDLDVLCVDSYKRGVRNRREFADLRCFSPEQMSLMCQQVMFS